MESADAQPRQGQQVHAADTAHAGNGHALAAQAVLLRLRDPAQVAGKCRVIGKTICHAYLYYASAKDQEEFDRWSGDKFPL
ncbi:hypothetical protein D3C72_2120980 [compost metagenome]